MILNQNHTLKSGFNFKIWFQCENLMKNEKKKTRFRPVWGEIRSRSDFQTRLKVGDEVPNPNAGPLACLACVQHAP
jgi:hypothetical protein